MKFKEALTSLAIAAGVIICSPGIAVAHCDGLDGPVVKAARKALETRTIADVLIWVQPADEPEIRAAFEEALAVRALGAQAKELADRYFFETVVRVHRAGEGAPYTGLKPAGRDLGPAIPAADKALDTRSLAPVLTLLSRTMEERLRFHFEHAVVASNFKSGDIAAGREYIKAYVEFIHYAERLHEAIAASPHGHFAESAMQNHRVPNRGK
jgi:hypothetical protein